MKRHESIDERLRKAKAPEFANPAHRERLERELRRAWPESGNNRAARVRARQVKRVYVLAGVACALLAITVVAAMVVQFNESHLQSRIRNAKSVERNSAEEAGSLRESLKLASADAEAKTANKDYYALSPSAAPAPAGSAGTWTLTQIEVGAADRPPMPGSGVLSDAQIASNAPLLEDSKRSSAQGMVTYNDAGVASKRAAGVAQSNSNGYGYYGNVKGPLLAPADISTNETGDKLSGPAAAPSSSAVAGAEQADKEFAKIPEAVIGDADVNKPSPDVDVNFFRYDNAFNILDFMTDDTTAMLRFSYVEGSTRENVSINGKHDVDGDGNADGLFVTQPSEELIAQSTYDSTNGVSSEGDVYRPNDGVYGVPPQGSPPPPSRTISLGMIVESNKEGYVSRADASGPPANAGVPLGLEFSFPVPADSEESEAASSIHGRQSAESNTEAYSRIYENPFLAVAQNPLSTFSIDVDTASYANVRRFLNNNQLPPPDAARIEELINYFDYDYPVPTNGIPFSVTTDLVDCPWNDAHWLLRVGLKGYELAPGQRPAANLVFLLDVSGSMNSPNKLPLVQESMRMLTDQLTADDTVSIVVYAGAAGLVLPATAGGDKQAILGAIDNLKAGGSTHGAEGIQLAYNTATENFKDEGINRVILATDGDFNVGVTNQGDLSRLIEKSAKESKVFLTCLGFGMGNYKDTTLETLADKGNGNYAYIDTANEARKALVEEINSTLVTIAKDVKIQIEFNPLKADSYRLIGYENRMLAAEDFNDDTKDAGEIGAGHTVTALYEIVPAGVASPAANGGGRAVDPLRYQESAPSTQAVFTDEALVVKLRYKQPDSDTSDYLEFPVSSKVAGFFAAPPDMQWAAAVAAFGLVLRDSEYKGAATLDFAERQAAQNVGADPFGYRAEFVELARKARELMAGKASDGSDRSDRSDE